jgi:predicted transcriptional regulator
MSTKADVIELIRKLPDNATLPEIVEFLEVRERIEEGIRQIEAGQSVPHEDVMKKLSRWFA